MGSRTLLLVLGLHFTLLGNIEARDCSLGFIAKGRQCDDIDECKEWDSNPPCGSNATCYNTQGSFYCHCLPGFRSTTSLKFTPFAGECKDLNECLENPPVCGSNTICINTIGSFNCQCQPGFRVTYAGHCAVYVCVCPLQMRMSVCGFPGVWRSGHVHKHSWPIHLHLSARAQ
ncbi:adhesion G protein-coupled receptor E1-like isoform X3 [Oncorhynchus tshawytscha]|uniref:adhesion G protein-coupled receptor E1-like isoform X3 n=1 Tax=Oncorhynchus tshawytscha TaxID=74940 RepID=UPI001C3DAD25|nr:adhesion G protein-coupled receptor E1-like isoform X3 [Oncorhynchus tshawytscha]